MIIKRPRRQIGIPVVAMSDIAFLLLIFLMISSMSSSKKSVRIVLPPASSSEKEKIKNTQEVYVTRSGTYFRDGKEVSLDELASIFGRLSTPQTPAVFIYGDEETEYRHIDEVTKLLYKNRLRRCVFVTKKRE